jgi:hypothetical protein
MLPSQLRYFRKALFPGRFNIRLRAACGMREHSEGRSTAQAEQERVIVNKLPGRIHV